MNVFAEDAGEERGENARLSSFVGALALGDLVKSTLGPKVIMKPSNANLDAETDHYSPSFYQSGNEQDPS